MPLGPRLLASTPDTGLGGVLMIIEHQDGQDSLAQLDTRGGLHPLGEPVKPPWSLLYSSTLGAWIVYTEEYRDGLVHVGVYDSRTGETQTIVLPLGAVSVGPAFDAATGRLAYTMIAQAGEQIDDRSDWVVSVHDLSTGSVTKYGGPWRSPENNELMDAEPIGWTGDDLLMETFTANGEGRTGVWALDTREGVPSQTVTVQAWDRQVLNPMEIAATGWYRSPSLAPNGMILAFQHYDDDYMLPCWQRDPYYGGLSSRLGIVPTQGGKPRILLDVADQERALDESVVWSPDGRQILFAEGRCRGDPPELEFALRAVDLQGAVTWEGPVVAVKNPLSFGMRWCEPEGIYYQADTAGLWHVDMATGRSDRVSVPEGARLFTCMPK